MSYELWAVRGLQDNGRWILDGYRRAVTSWQPQVGTHRMLPEGVFECDFGFQNCVLKHGFVRNFQKSFQNRFQNHPKKSQKTPFFAPFFIKNDP
jgi:hypothetical protein